MKYSELVEIYQKLEKTSKKLEKTHILSNFLKKVPSDSLEQVVSLLTGNVFPSWSEKEIGIANQTMIKAIAKVTGLTESEVNKTFAKEGDLGLTAEVLMKKKKQKTLLKKTLNLEDVFNIMRKIADQSGKGSQEIKLNMISQLLSSAEPEEALYISRTMLEELRVGVAEGLLRDAIAEAFEVPVEAVENAWFLYPDYGEIAKIAKEKGEAGLKKIKIEVGRPIMVLLAEKAPDLKTALNSYENVALEYKYDGARINVHKKGDKITLFTRRLENVTAAFPDLVEICKKAIKAKECIIEGEALAIDKKTGRPVPFQMLSQRIKRKYDIEETAKEIPVELHLFDAMYIDGKTLFNVPLKERRKMLSKIIKVIPGKIVLAKQLITKDLEKAEKFYKEALEAGQEGVMVKNLDAFYVPGRTVAGGWLKVKPIMETLDLAIIGATWGTGKRAGWMGSFILGIRDPETGKFLECGMLGSGLKEKKTLPTDVTMEDLTKYLKPYIESEKGLEIKIKPKIIIEVAYEEIQKSPTYSSGWALRFPRLIRVRWDKSPSEADDLKRIEELYKQQKGKKQ